MEALLSKLLRGHTGAIALCISVFDWANDYDHLVDGDVAKATPEELVHRMAIGVLNWQSNPFYDAHRHDLANTVRNCITGWRISTTLQRAGDPNGHEIAHVLRWMPIEFFLHCARILHGEDWVQEIGPWFWVQMTKDHSFSDFARECGG